MTEIVLFHHAQGLTDGVLVTDAADGELFVYPGSAHLVTDNSLDEYDAEITSAVLTRTLTFLDRHASPVLD